MSTICSAPVAAQRTAQGLWLSVLAAIMKRWWMAYTTWRTQQTAIARLRAMSDWELKDVGLTRSNITDAVRGQALRGRAVTGSSRWPLELIKPQQLMSKQSNLAMIN